VRRAVLDAEPEAIIHQATALAHARFGRSLDRTFAQTNRLRIEGTDALLAAAREAGVRRFVAQSFANYRYAREGGMVKNEKDAVDPSPAPNTRETNAAMNHLDRVVTDAGGIALRYGGFYGPQPHDSLVTMVRKRQFPIIRDGEGMTSWIHLDDAAAATVLALEHDEPAIFNIVDDEPAPAREWLPVLAEALGAKPPRRIPLWLARLFAGEAAVAMSEARGASNAVAKRELGRTLGYASWRDDFPAAYRLANDSSAVSELPAPHRERG
jgi:nucleoside-diphosphate-sugar epimerase